MQKNTIQILDLIPIEYRKDDSVSRLSFCGFFVDHCNRLKLQLTRMCDGAVTPFLFDLGEPVANPSLCATKWPSYADVVVAGHEFHVIFINLDSNTITIEHYFPG